MIKVKTIEDIFEELILSIGDIPNRDGLKDSPRRIAESYSEILNGYGKNPKDLIKVFESDYKGMIIFNKMNFYSLCEHHFLPILGTIDIGIIPSSKTNNVIGFNKIPRLVDIFAHRLQIQERLTKEITDCIYELIEPEGVGVIIKARHLCAEMRSIRKIGQNIISSDFRGSFLKKSIKNEFILKLNNNS